MLILISVSTLRFPQETGEVSATAWSVLIKSEEIALLLAFAAGGVIYVLNVETGEYHGILLGHGGVCEPPLIVRTERIDRHLLENKRTGSPSGQP